MSGVTVSNKQVLITGATTGIGRATALAFAGRGTHIIAVDLDAARLAALCAEIEALGCRAMQGSDLLMAGPFARLSDYAKRLVPGLLRRATIHQSKNIGFIYG